MMKWALTVLILISVNARAESKVLTQQEMQKRITETIGAFVFVDLNWTGQSGVNIMGHANFDREALLTDAIRVPELDYKREGGGVYSVIMKAFLVNDHAICFEWDGSTAWGLIPDHRNGRFECIFSIKSGLRDYRILAKLMGESDTQLAYSESR